MQNFTTNMALRDCFQNKRDIESTDEEKVLSKEIKKKLKLIERAFR